MMSAPSAKKMEESKDHIDTLEGKVDLFSKIPHEKQNRAIGIDIENEISEMMINSKPFDSLLSFLANLTYVQIEALQLRRVLRGSLNDNIPSVFSRMNRFDIVSLSMTNETVRSNNHDVKTEIIPDMRIIEYLFNNSRNIYNYISGIDNFSPRFTERGLRNALSVMYLRSAYDSGDLNKLYDDGYIKQSKSSQYIVIGRTVGSVFLPFKYDGKHRPIISNLYLQKFDEVYVKDGVDIINSNIVTLISITGSHPLEPYSNEIYECISAINMMIGGQGNKFDLVILKLIKNCIISINEDITLPLLDPLLCNSHGFSIVNIQSAGTNYSSIISDSLSACELSDYRFNIRKNLKRTREDELIKPK